MSLRGYFVALVLPLVGLLPASARAQGVARDFQELQGRVLLGETVKVTDRGGQATRGKLLKLTDTDLTVRVDEQDRTLPGADIVEVKARRSGPLWNGAVIGAAVVLIPSAFLAAEYGCGDCALGIAVWTGIAAAAGVGVDALIKGDVTVMKLQTPTRAKTGFTIAPLVQRERRGVLCSIRF